MRYTRWIPTVLASAGLLLFISVGHAAPTTAPSGTATITGTIKDMAGKPAVHATVNLTIAATTQPTATEAPAAGAPKHHKMTVLKSVTTDDDGNFKFEDVKPGDYAVTARLRGLGNAVVHLSIKDGETKDIQMTLAKRPPAAGAKPTT